MPAGYVCEYKLAHSGVARQLRGLRGCQVGILAGHLGFSGAVGGFSDKYIGIAHRLNQAGCLAGVAGQRQLGAALQVAQYLIRLDYTAVLQRDRLAVDE